MNLIETEGLQLGDRLPSVQSLTTRFAVATPTVRESLRRLQAIGMIDIHHGSGIYVRRRERRVVLANPYPGEPDARIILDLLDARLLIEGELAGLAATNGSVAEIAELEQLLEDAGRLLDGEDDTRLDRDNMSFHRSVARMAGNTILSHTIDSILDLYGAEQQLILGLFGDRRRDHEEHLTVLQGIRARDAKQAAVAMRLHLADVRSVLAARLTSPPRAKSGRAKKREGEEELSGVRATLS